MSGSGHLEVASHHILFVALLHGTHIDALVAGSVRESDRTGDAAHRREPTKGAGGVTQCHTGALVGADDTILVGLPCLGGAVTIEIAGRIVGNGYPLGALVGNASVELEAVSVAFRLIPLQEYLVGVVALGGVEGRYAGCVVVVEVGPFADNGLRSAALHFAVRVGELYRVGVLGTRYLSDKIDVGSVGAIGLSSEFCTAHDTLGVRGVRTGDCGASNYDFCRTIPEGTPVFGLRLQVQNDLLRAVKIGGFRIVERVILQGDQFRVFKNTIHGHPGMPGIAPVDRTGTDKTIVDRPSAVGLVV